MKGLTDREIVSISEKTTLQGGFFTSGVYVITTIPLQQAKIAILISIV
ncbi:MULTISPECIES: hypothetical protein [Vibrio]|nr:MULTISPECIES: hypothetical protein [unclassified Vibrio]MCA2459453.1 hypothetical protein [Vibrio alginolyticus]MDF4761285.1 hypothetical protein [Vibrio parahaemolyticus]MDW2298337.1 hypothetical protein [Vibrio sp. 1404]MDW3189214.1 hypothetical protein [Vibrio sp. Vb0932]MDF4777012.1 hypothetical protein [Vibrio parahaemolyticus]